MIDLYQFDNANSEGDKEAVVFPNQPTLVNKLSANEANGIKDKINEIIEAIPDGVADTVVAYPILALRFKGEGNTLPTIQVGDRVQGMADSSTLWLDATYNGGNVTNRSNYTVNSSGTVDGNIKPRSISVGYLGNDNLAEFAGAVNTMATRVVSGEDLPVLYFYDANILELGESPKPSYRFLLNKKPPYTLGAGGITITPSNLIYLSQTYATVDEIESMQGTQIIDLGEIGTVNVWDFLNLKDPIVSIQDIAQGYRVVKTLVSGVSVRYLFLGVGGDYGVGVLQSVEGDFDIQSGEIVPSDNSDTKATKIEITFADLGVATIAEVTDAMVLAYINGLGLVKSRKEFYVVSVEELRYIITDLPEGLVDITSDQLLKFDGIGGGTEPSVIFPDTKLNYVDSKSFTIEEGVKVLTFKKNGSTISIDWTQVGNVITYNGLEDLDIEDYFIYNGIKAVSIVEVSGNVPDATSTVKGKLKLAGDLAGTADEPTVPALQNIYTKSEVDAKVSSVYVVKESVANLTALNDLTSQVVGWVRNVNDSGMNYVYTASGWDALGATIDISGKEDTSNKISAITGASTDKYTSEKAVVDYVATKITQKPLHVFYKLPTPLTGTTAGTIIHTFTLPKIYQEGRRVRISGKLLGTGTGSKTLNIANNTDSIRNIVHSIGTTTNSLPFVRNMIFFDDQYIYPNNGGAFLNDEATAMPTQSFSATPFQSASTVTVWANLVNAADSILAIDILFEFFD